MGGGGAPGGKLVPGSHKRCELGQSTNNKVKYHKHGEMCQILIGNFGSFYFLLSEFYINGKKEKRNNFVYWISFVY